MGRVSGKILSSIWLIIAAVLIVQPANAQTPKRYPSADKVWDATDYRALVERIERAGLALPTLSGGDSKEVFERMINGDNIPLRMGQDKELAITVRYQKLEPVLKPINELLALYSTGMKEGKPYSAEIARLTVYQSKVSGILLDIGKPYLASLAGDRRYHYHVKVLEKMKGDARKLYVDLVASINQTGTYSKRDLLVMIEGAIRELPPYHGIITDQDRSKLSNVLTQQISATADAEVKKGLTELRDAIKHRRVRT